MRGTTATLTYELPFSIDMISKAKIVIKYGDTVLIRKAKAECELADNSISVKLTRAETVKLPENDRVSIQLEIETPAGDSMVTDPETIYTGQLLDEEDLK